MVTFHLNIFIFTLMNELTSALRKAVGDKNWYAALALALSLPDICGWLDSGETKVGLRYQAWFKQYLNHHYDKRLREKEPGIVSECGPFLNGSDCYALRCAFLHQGLEDLTEQNAKKVLSRVYFHANDKAGHCVMVNDLLSLDVRTFCGEVADAADAWFAARGNDPKVKERSDKRLLIYSLPFVQMVADTTDWNVGRLT